MNMSLLRMVHQETCRCRSALLHRVFDWSWVHRAYCVQKKPVWPYDIHFRKRTQDGERSYYYPLYCSSSTKEVIIYILAIRYGLTTYIFARGRRMRESRTVIHYIIFFYKRSYNIHTSYSVWPYYIHICKKAQQENN
jgi:hypothetical protein